jgi:ketosteroid isomerase-like protein
MQESESVALVAKRFIDAVAAGDADATIGFHSADARALLIGTEEGEWYDQDEYAAWVREHLGSFRIEHGPVSAYEEGSVGWLATTLTLILDDGERIETRLTAVLHREDGEWKFVQRHLSVALPGT